MGSSGSVQTVAAADPVVAAVAREPSTSNADAQEAARSRLRGIASTYSRFSTSGSDTSSGNNKLLGV